MEHNEAEEREIHRVILELSKRQALINKEEDSVSDTIEKAHRIGQAFYAFIATIAGVAVWVAWMQFTINILHAQVDTNTSVISAQARLLAALQNQVEHNSRTIEDRRETIRRAEELWTMKELGVDNSETFSRKKSPPRSP